MIQVLRKYWAILLISLFVDLVPLAGAQSTDMIRIEIGLALFPKVMAVNTNLLESVSNIKQVNLALLVDDIEAGNNTVTSMAKEKLQKILGKQVNLQLVSLDTLANGSDEYHGLFLVSKLEQTQLKNLIDICSKRGILTFSPHVDDVKKGIAAGFSIDSQVKLTFNLTTLKKSGIGIIDQLLNIADTYE